MITMITLIMVVYAIVMLVTYTFADCVLFKAKLMAKDKWESSEKEDKAACVLCAVLWPITLAYITKFYVELNELDAWR